MGFIQIFRSWGQGVGSLYPGNKDGAVPTLLLSGKQPERALKSQAQGGAAHAGSIVLGGEGIEYQETARVRNMAQPGQQG